MVFRRHKTLWQVLILVIVVGTTFKFSYNYYTENERRLRAANIRHHELLDDRNKMSRELEGVIESKNNLELALRTKTQKLADLKKEWNTERDILENKANKHKSSFDALDSEYRMIKAKNDDLQIDYDHMKKSYNRLKEDHAKLDSEHRNNFSELKQKNEKIIVALQKQVEHYQNQENLKQLKVQKLEENLEQYQNIVARLQKKLDESAAKIDSLAVSKVNIDRKALNAADKAPLSSKTRRRRLAKGLNPKNDVKKRFERVVDDNKALKQKQFFQDLRKLGDESQGTQDRQNEADEEKNNNYVEMRKANAVEGGQNEVIRNEEKSENDERQNGVNNIEKKVDVWTGQNDVINNERKQQDNGGQNDENGVERKENIDNIEVINKDGKDEQNFNLDAQQNIEAKERQALVEQHKGLETLQRDKRGAEEQVNIDQKSDDEEIALQEGDNGDNVADENEEDEMLEQPENLLLNREEEAQDREENLKW